MTWKLKNFQAYLPFEMSTMNLEVASITCLVPCTYSISYSLSDINKHQ